MVAHAHRPRASETEAGESQNQGKFDLHNKVLFQKKLKWSNIVRQSVLGYIDLLLCRRKNAPVMI